MNIVVKLPNDLNQKILTFPFLHMLEKLLRQQLEEEEVLNIHLISLDEYVDTLNLLPFKAFYHEVERSDLKNIFSMHRACMNFKIDRVDAFISTTDSFVDASIGKNIRAKMKIGFSVGKNSWFLTKKIAKFSERHFSEQVFELLSPINKGGEELEISNVSCREMPPAFADWKESPYIMINLDQQEDEINPEWDDFFDLFVNKNFVFICSEAEKDLQKSLLEDYVGKLSKKNSYKVHEYDSHIDFGRLASYCEMFISHDSPLINIAAYCGANIYHLNQKMNIKFEGAQFFKSWVKHFSISDSRYKKGQSFNYTKIFDELYNDIEKIEEASEEGALDA